MNDFAHTCPLCNRAVPKVSKHHMTPKSRGGRITLEICLDCHAMIHALFPNKQLSAELNSVEALQQHPEFAKYLKWIANKRADRRYNPVRSKKTRRRGRSG